MRELVISSEPIDPGLHAASFDLPLRQLAPEAGAGEALIGPAGEAEVVVLHAWFYPSDPALAALPTAHDLPAMSRYVGEDVISASRVVYRPTRRAMVCLRGPSGPVAWAKVMRPDKVEHLLRATQLLAEAGVPIAPLVGSPQPGILIQRHGRGQRLSEMISAEPNAAVGMFGQLRALLDQLPAAVTSLPRRPAWTDRRAHYARAMSALLPDLDGQVRDLVAAAEACLIDEHPVVATHGDFFEANLLTEGEQITTLLDLDTVGPGRRADDYACLLAHLSVLPFLTPQRWVVPNPSEPYRDRLERFLPGRRCPSYPASEVVLEGWRQFAAAEVEAAGAYGTPVGVAATAEGGAPATAGHAAEAGKWAADLYARCAFVTLSLASSTSLAAGEDEARARFARACWWAHLAVDARG